MFSAWVHVGGIKGAPGMGVQVISKNAVRMMAMKLFHSVSLIGPALKLERIRPTIWQIPVGHPGK